MVEYRYCNTMVYVASLLLSLSSTYALIIIIVSMSFRCIAKKTNLRDFSDIFGFRCTLQFILHHSFFLEKLEKPIYSNNIITNNIKREFQSRRVPLSSSQIEPHETHHHILHQLQSFNDSVSTIYGVPKIHNDKSQLLISVFSTSLALLPWSWFNRCSKNDVGFIVAAQMDIHHVSDYRVMTIDGVLKLRSTWIVSVVIKYNSQSLRDIFHTPKMSLLWRRIEMSVAIHLYWLGPFLLFLLFTELLSLSALD